MISPFFLGLKLVLDEIDLDAIIMEVGDYIDALTIADNYEGFDLQPTLLQCDTLAGPKPSTGFGGDAEASLTQRQTRRPRPARPRLL